MGEIEMTPRFEILGPVRAFRGAQQVDLGPPQQQALLAVLLLEAGTPVPMNRIIAALWNGDPPENGVDVVQRHVGGLRRGLDPERTSLLALADGGYVLRVVPEAVDAGVFRAAVARARSGPGSGSGDPAGELRRALGLFRAEPLAGLGGPAFDAARARLNDEYKTAAQLVGRLARPGPAAAQPVRTAQPAHAEPAHAEPANAEPANAEPANAEPANAQPGAAESAYAEPADPWAGHDLFPPDPRFPG